MPTIHAFPQVHSAPLRRSRGQCDQDHLIVNGAQSLGTVPTLSVATTDQALEPSRIGTCER
jgi:hypothetical protein